jgi:hypothetical protein
MTRKKGETDLTMAYTSVYNWIRSLDINDKASVDVLIKAQDAMNEAVNEVIEE